MTLVKDRPPEEEREGRDEELERALAPRPAPEPPHANNRPRLHSDRERRSPDFLCSLDAERAVLGAVLLWPHALEYVSAIVGTEDFWHPAHATIFRAMHDVSRDRVSIDIVSLSAKLRDYDRLNAVGGMQYLGELTESVVAFASVEEHARLVVKMARRREITRISTALREAAMNGDDAAIEGLLARAAKASPIAKDGPVDLESAMIEVIERTVQAMEAAASGEESAHLGLRTGIDPIDEQIRAGLMGGDTVVIAGGTSAGKSALAQQIATNIVHERPDEIVIYASLEMDRVLLAEREVGALASEARFVDEYGMERTAEVPQHLLRTGQFSADQAAAFEAVMRRDLSAYGRFETIDDFALGIEGLRAYVTRARAHRGRKIAAVIIDYLQLLAPESDDYRAEAAIANVSRQCKMLAKNEKCVVFLLSQFNRKYSADDRPRLGHLKGGSCIEQDASVAILLHRPDLAAAKTIAYVDKNRHGPVFETQLEFVGVAKRFTWSGRGTE